MRSTLRLTARAALMALLALAVLLTSGCATTVADAQQGPYPYPGPTTAVPATAVPATAVPATAVPATAVPGTAVPTTAATVAPTVGNATTVPTAVRPAPTAVPTPRPTTGLPNTGGGALPAVLGVALLALAGAVALARRRLS